MEFLVLCPDFQNSLTRNRAYWVILKNLHRIPWKSIRVERRKQGFVCKIGV